MFFQSKRAFCATVAAVAVVASASAGMADVRNPSRSAPAADVQKGTNIQLAHSGLNLLRGGESDRRKPKRRRAAVGHGSYICSPAGFGQRSRCYSN